MFNKLTILAVIFFALAAVSLYAAGDWEMTTSDARRGTQTQVFTIVQDGEKITVTMAGTVSMGERGSREWTAKKK